MYLRYGSFTHPVSECAVTISKKPLYNEGGTAIGHEETWNIQGMIQAADQATLTANIATLKLAYSTNAGDLLLYDNNSVLTAHALYSNQCIGGTRVVDGPNFPEGSGAEYSTYRHYTIAVTGKRLNTQVIYLAWHESISFTGGGPRDMYLQPITGFPVRQRVAQSTPYKCTQSGRAIGQYSYPPVSPPIWPASEFPDRRRIVFENPKREGPLGSPFFTEFPVSWTYEFESGLPLLGAPRPMPG